MTDKGIDIVGIQETHTPKNTKEKRTDYTWYLNGTEEGEREYAGVGIIVSNKWGKYLEDIIPHSNRIVEIKMAGAAPITILSIYAPQSGSSRTDKEGFYTQLNAVIAQINKKGPFIIMGDWNAKIQEAETEE